MVLYGAIHSLYILVACAQNGTAELAAEAEETRLPKVARCKKAPEQAAHVDEAQVAGQHMVCRCGLSLWPFCGRIAMEGQFLLVPVS